MLGIPGTQSSPSRSNLTLWPVSSLLAPPPRREGAAMAVQPQTSPKPLMSSVKTPGSLSMRHHSPALPPPAIASKKAAALPCFPLNRPDTAERLRWFSLASRARRPSALTARPSPTPADGRKQGKARHAAAIPTASAAGDLHLDGGRSPLLDGEERSTRTNQREERLNRPTCCISGLRLKRRDFKNKSQTGANKRKWHGGYYFIILQFVLRGASSIGNCRPRGQWLVGYVCIDVFIYK